MEEKETVQSKLYIEERVDNQDHKFGETNEYFPAYVDIGDGVVKPALFTYNQIQEALERAKINMEDMKKEHKSFSEKFFGF